MTRDALADELFPILNEEPQEKSKVTHVFIQVRKMLEHDQHPAKYWILKFFCDWIAHPKLAGTGARQVLQILDERLPTFNFRKLEGVDPDGMVSKILSFDFLRHNLGDFLKENKLPTRWTEDDFTWKTVVQFYGQQIQNQPLVIDPKRPLKFISKVEIVACEPHPEIVVANPNEKFHGFVWVVTLNNGRAFSWPYTGNLPEKPANWPTQGVRTAR